MIEADAIDRDMESRCKEEKALLLFFPFLKKYSYRWRPFFNNLIISQNGDILHHIQHAYYSSLKLFIAKMLESISSVFFTLYIFSLFSPLEGVLFALHESLSWYRENFKNPFSKCHILKNLFSSRVKIALIQHTAECSSVRIFFFFFFRKLIQWLERLNVSLSKI